MTLTTQRDATTGGGWQRWGALGLVGAGLTMLAVRDPNQAGSYGLCPLNALTGLDCPFCGGLRGTHALLHGDVATAIDHNVLVPLYLAVMGVIGVMWWRSADGSFLRGRSKRRSVIIWALVAVTAVFFVVRNLPWFPYLDSAA